MFRSEINFLSRLCSNWTQDIDLFLKVIYINHRVLQLLIHFQGQLELLLFLHDELLFGVVLCLAFGSLLGCELLEDAVRLIRVIVVPGDGPSSLVHILRSSKFFDKIFLIRRRDNSVLIIRLWILLIASAMFWDLYSCLVNIYGLRIDVSS